MRGDLSQVLRHKIESCLASGLLTECRVRGDSMEPVVQIVTRLRIEAGDDMRSKLIIGGFTNHPVHLGGMLQTACIFRRTTSIASCRSLICR